MTKTSATAALRLCQIGISRRQLILIVVSLLLGVIINAPAFAAPPSYTPIDTTIDEDTSTGVMGLAIIDPDIGDTHTVSVTAQPVGATVTVIGTDVSVEPDSDFSGALTFELVVCDQGLECVTEMNVVTVTAINDPPSTSPISFATNYETASAAQTPIISDPDVGDVHSVEIVTASPNGTAMEAPGASIVFVPNPGYFGVTSFEFRVCDALGICSSPVAAEVTVAQPTLSAPTFTPLSAVVSEDGITGILSLSITDQDVGDTHTVSVPTQPDGGSVSVIGVDVLVAPDPDFNGTMTFNLTVCDQTARCTTLPNTVTVTAVNDTPMSADLAFATALDTPSSEQSPGIVDPDDGDTHTIEVTTQSEDGIATPVAGAKVVFTPNAGFSGNTTFFFRICDAALACSVSYQATVTVSALGTAPTFVPVVTTIAEDTATGPLSLSITDPDVGDTHTVTVLAQPTGGTVSVSGLDIEVTPDPDYTGTLSFAISVCDQVPLCTSLANSVMVSAVNDAPNAANMSISTIIGTASAPQTPVISDPDTGDSHTLEILSQSPDGIATPGAGASVVFMPNAGYAGATSFQFRVCDAALSCSPGYWASVVVTAPPGTAPSFTPIAVTIDEDTDTGTLGLAIVDPDVGDTHTVSVLGQPSGGTVTLIGSDVLISPDSNFNGAMSFDLKVCDQALACDTQSNSVIVTPVNDAPLTGPVNFSTPFATVSAVQYPAVEDPDIGDTHTTEIVSAAVGGAVFVSADGGFTFSPDPDFSGNTTFQFRVCDASDCSATQVATVNVGSQPRVAPVLTDGTIATNVDTMSAWVALVISGTDPMESYAFDVVSTPEVGGIVDLKYPEVSYAPPPGFFGNTSFKVKACDTQSLCSNAATVSVTVSNASEYPSLLPTSINTQEDTTSAWESVTVTDPTQGDTHTLIQTSSSPNGILEINGLGIRFSPFPNFSGATSVDIRACDAMAQCSVASTVQINVTPVSDPPEMTGNVEMLAWQNHPSVWFNIPVRSPDGQTGLYFSLITPPATGTVETDPDDPLIIRYVPNDGATSDDTFEFVICDPRPICSAVQIGEVTMDVLNTPPSADTITINTEEDTTSAWYTPVVVDPDPGDTHSVEIRVPSLVGTAEVSGSDLRFVPVENFSGTTNFRFRVCDNNGGCSVDTVAVIIVNPSNDPPTVEPVSITTAQDLASNYVEPTITDPDPGDTHTYEIMVQSVEGTAEASVLGMRFLPTPGFQGETTFEYRVCDAAALCSTNQIASVTVTRSNTPPSVNPLVVSTNEDESTGPTAVAIIDPDANETHVLSLSVPAGHGTIVIAATSFEYTPAADWFGTDSATFLVCDALSACATFDVEFDVAAVNDPPILLPISIATQEDTVSDPIALTVSDVDSSSIPTFSITQGADGVASISADAVTFMPNPNFSGATSFTIEVCDNMMECINVVVPVMVELVNDAPVATALEITTDEDTRSTPTTVSFSDEDSFDTHTLEISQNPDIGTAQVEASGTEITYMPAADYNGADYFFVEVCDQNNACSEAEVTVTVNPVNDPPSSIELSILTKQDTQSEWFTAAVVDPDVDDMHAISVLVQPLFATIDTNATLDAARALPDVGASGIQTFQIEACDLAGACISGDATIEIVAAQALVEEQDVSVPLVAQSVLGMGGGNPIHSSPIILRDGTGGVVDGLLSVSVTLSADAPVSYLIAGVLVNPGESADLGVVDFGLTSGRLDLPMAPESVVDVSPGYGGKLEFVIDDPYAPDLHSDILLWEPRENIEVSVEKLLYTKKVEPVRITGRATGSMCGGNVLVYDGASNFDDIVKDRAYCAVRWSVLPPGLEQSAERVSPYVDGYFDTTQALESVVYDVGIVSFDTEGAPFFAPSQASEQIDFTLTDPLAPAISFSPVGQFAKRQQYIPEGQWPSEVGAEVKVGTISARTEFAGVVLTVTSPSFGVYESQSPHTSVLSDIKTGLENLWDVEDVVVRAAYQNAPTIFSEITLSFTATPATPTLKIIKPDVVTNTAPVVIEGNLGAYDYSSGQFNYDSAIQGDWMLTLYRANPDRSRDALSAPVSIASPNGQFSLAGDVLSVGTQRLIVVAELYEGGVNTGKTIESSTILVSVKDATPIEITLSANRDYGTTPFTPTLRAKLQNARRSSDASAVEWEYSDNAGGSWTQIVRDTRYARAFAYAETMDTAGTRSYRATTVNRHSGERYVSNAVDVTGYVLPEFTVSGYSDTFVDYPIDWSVDTSEVLPVQYEWTVKKGYGDRTPETLTGTDNTLSADVAGTWYVDIRARFLSSLDVPEAWRKVSKRLTVRPPSIRRPIVSGPVRLEIGKTYTYTVKTDHCLDPRLQPHLTLNGRWVMPDGSYQTGSNVTYTPVEGDEKSIIYEVWVDGYQAETRQVAKRNLSFWSYEWPQWYLYDKTLFPYTPGRITYQIKQMSGGYLGDETVTYDWTIPPGAIIERNDGSRITVRYESEGAWTVEGTASDTRGNMQTIAHTFDVTPPPPLNASLSVIVGDSWNRAPADLIARWSVSGLVPGERIESVTASLNGTPFSNSTSTSLRTNASVSGTHTIAVEVVSSDERTATAIQTVDLIVGDPPTCSITVRGDGVRSLDAQAVCSAPMGILKSFHWWVTYTDDGSTQDLGLRGSRILMSSVGLGRGISGITLVAINDKGQESAPSFWAP